LIVDRWGVKTDSHDVGCGLFYQGSSNLKKEVEVIVRLILQTQSAAGYI
jgi:hypothetical protein